MKSLLLDSFNLAEMSSAVVARHITRARTMMVVLLAIFVGYLVFGPKPFDPEIRDEMREIVATTPEGQLPDLDLEHYIVTGSYTMAIINTILTAALLATAGIWAKPVPTSATEVEQPLFIEDSAWWDADWWFWGALAVVALGGFFLRLPMAEKSLWWDEGWTVKRVIVGYEQPRSDNPAELKFKDVGWDRTFFYYDKPTNHVGYSVPARISVGFWRTLTGADDAAFNEIALRLPALLAGLGSILLMGLLFRDLGYPGLGIAAALLLALHPWHMRYTVEARGFSIVILCSLFIAFMLIRALRFGNWRYWIGCGLGHLLLLWTFPYGIFLSITLALFTVAGILIYQGGLFGGGTFLMRFFVSHLLAGMVFLQLVAPWLPQIKRWGGMMEMDESKNWVTGELLTNFWTLSTVGVPWKLPGNAEGEYTDLSSIFASYPFPLELACLALVFGVFPILIILGFLRLGLFAQKANFVPMALLLAVPLTILVAYLQGHYFYERYMIFALPGFVICLILGTYTAASLGRDHFSRLGNLGVLCLFPVYLFLASPQIASQLSRPISPMRDVARFLLEKRSPETPQHPVRAGFQHGGSMPALYDPFMHLAEDAGDLHLLAAQARQQQTAFYVFYAHENFNRTIFNTERYGFPFDLLDNPEFFEEVQTYRGLTPEEQYTILKYTGGDLGKAPDLGRGEGEEAAAMMEIPDAGLRPADQDQDDPETPAPSVQPGDPESLTP